MLYDSLFVLTIFGTRIVLPMVATLLLGGLLERALRRDVRSA